MRHIEEDLGTRLDWVAVDHFNTGHPHSHVVVRGRDDLGKDLIIAQDYITDGMRQRAQERATLELGPETDLELRAKLEAEVSAERFTRIDRAMIAEADEGVLDMRPETGRVQANFDRTLRIGRLQTLGRYGWRRNSSRAYGRCRSAWRRSCATSVNATTLSRRSIAHSPTVGRSARPDLSSYAVRKRRHRSSAT
jgi:type IV secretory pathway VirD2 relaxase